MRSVVIQIVYYKCGAENLLGRYHSYIAKLHKYDRIQISSPSVKCKP